MKINSKKLNNQALYNNYKSFFPNYLYSPNQLRNLECEKFMTKNNKKKNNNNALKTHLVMNISNNNICENEDQNNLANSKILKGGKALSNSSYRNLQKYLNKYTKFGRLKTCQIFYDAKNKLNKSNQNATNELFNSKVPKIKSSKKFLNQSCPLINKQGENSERINEKKMNNEEEDFNSQMEDEKNFSSKQSNIFKIEYIKKLIRKHYFDNFDNLKDYFNNMRGKDNDNYLNIEDIIFYLREIIKVNIDKKEIRQLLYNNGIIKVDFTNFKFIFFPDLRQNKMINLKLKNEKCNFFKDKVCINIHEFDNLSKNKSTSKIKNNNNISSEKIKEYKKNQNVNKSIQERSYQRSEINKKLRIRGLNNKMKFLLMDINKDFIIKRFNEKYNFNKKYLELDKYNKYICNQKMGQQYKRNINGNYLRDNDIRINEELWKNKNYINKDKLQLYILKINSLNGTNINKLEEMKKYVTSNNNFNNIKEIKNDDIKYHTKRICDKFNQNNLHHKILNPNRYLRNEIKNIIGLEKNENETLTMSNKMPSFYINKTKDNSLHSTNLKRTRTRTMNPIKEDKYDFNKIVNQEGNKPFLFFSIENGNNNSEEVSPTKNIKKEKEYKINKNSDILNFLNK